MHNKNYILFILNKVYIIYIIIKYIIQVYIIIQAYKIISIKNNSTNTLTKAKLLARLVTQKNNLPVKLAKLNLGTEIFHLSLEEIEKNLCFC